MNEEDRKHLAGKWLLTTEEYIVDVKRKLNYYREKDFLGIREDYKYICMRLERFLQHLYAIQRDIDFFVKNPYTTSSYKHFRFAMFPFLGHVTETVQFSTELHIGNFEQTFQEIEDFMIQLEMKS